MPLSNEADIVEEATAGTISITATPADVPATGGPVTISGTTNEPDGTMMTLLVDGVADPNTAPVASAGGAFSFTFQVPPNTTLSPIKFAFTVSSP